jgi:hypothetical protein
MKNDELLKMELLKKYFEVFNKSKTDDTLWFLSENVFSDVSSEILERAVTASIRYDEHMPSLSKLMDAINDGAFTSPDSGTKNPRTILPATDGPLFTTLEILHNEMNDTGFNQTDYKSYRDFLIKHDDFDFTLENEEGAEYLVLPYLEELVSEDTEVRREDLTESANWNDC